jgi:hypothetical protein
MSIEERLFALAQQYRDRNGAAAMADATQFVPQLSSQAPDLHVEIRALAAAVQANAAGRIAGSANGDLEAAAVAAEIAAAQKLSMASVTPAVAVARRLGATPAAMPAAPAGGSWAGDSVIAGSSPPPPYAPQVAPMHPGYAPPPLLPPVAEGAAKPPYYQNKWVLGGLAVVLLALGYQQMNPQPGSGPQPPQPPVNGPNPPPQPPVDWPQPPQPPSPPPGPDVPTASSSSGGVDTSGGSSGGGGNQFPALAPPNSPQPTLSIRPQGQGFIIGFSVKGAAGLVSLPPGGWENGNTSLMLTRNPQSQQPESVGSGKFQRLQSGNNPVRVAQIQWQQDNVGIGPSCVAFIGNGGQDVALKGAKMCLMDGACNRPVGCGQLP